MVWVEGVAEPVGVAEGRGVPEAVGVVTGEAVPLADGPGEAPGWSEGCLKMRSPQAVSSKSVRPECSTFC